jgi:hypothetical protein
VQLGYRCATSKVGLLAFPDRSRSLKRLRQVVGRRGQRSQGSGELGVILGRNRGLSAVQARCEFVSTRCARRFDFTVDRVLAAMNASRSD